MVVMLHQDCINGRRLRRVTCGCHVASMGGGSVASMGGGSGG